jgi:membrane protein
MLRKLVGVLKAAAPNYVSDDCLSRGAAIAFYTMFSLAPILIIVIAVAAAVFGEATARGAILHQIRALIGQQGADAVQTMIASTRARGNGVLGGAIGIISFLVTATGVFTEMQTALNVIWKAKPSGMTVSRLVWVRLQSLGLVAALGFLLVVSLVASTMLAAVGDWLNGLFSAADRFLQVVNFLVSFGLVAILFGAIYKVLPDVALSWRDVAIGGVITSILFEAGKFLISLYLGSSSITSSFGAAGALAIVLLWVYYSSQIILLGAELTRAWADQD